MVGKFAYHASITPRVLVVDDEENLRLVASVPFCDAEGRNTRSRSLRAVREALSLASTPSAPTYRPSVILTDVRMPKMGGLDLLATLKAKGNDATVIVMSAYGNVDLALEAIKAGAYDYIQKPFKPEELVLTLRKAEERESPPPREPRAQAGDPAGSRPSRTSSPRARRCRPSSRPSARSPTTRPRR
jgi:DNA-binding NtrC family response regulator